MFLSLPATAALLVASKEITSALFGYGSFDKLSVQNTSLALFYFALGMPAFAFIKVFSSFLFARHNTKIPFSFFNCFSFNKYNNKFIFFLISWFYYHSLLQLLFLHGFILFTFFLSDEKKLFFF